MKRATPYLMFLGNAEEAFAFYHRVFGGEAPSILRYRDMGTTGDDADEARRLLGALADGGTVSMPLERVAWSELFGSCVDRFGVHWMVDFAGEVEFGAT